MKRSLIYVCIIISLILICISVIPYTTCAYSEQYQAYFVARFGNPLPANSNYPLNISWSSFSDRTTLYNDYYYGDFNNMNMDHKAAYYYFTDDSYPTGINGYFWVEYLFTLPDNWYGNNILNCSFFSYDIGDGADRTYSIQYLDPADDTYKELSSDIVQLIGTEWTYSDAGLGDYTYSICYNNVLLDLSNMSEHYTMYKIRFYNRFRLPPNFSMADSEGGLSFADAEELKTYNVVRFPYSEMFVDFNYSTNFEDATEQLLNDISSGMTSGFGSVNNSISNLENTIQTIYGEVDQAVINRFEDKLNDVSDTINNYEDQENSVFNGMDDAMSSIQDVNVSSAFAGNALVAMNSAIPVWTRVSNLIYNMDWVIATVTLVMSAGLIYYILTGKSKG